MASAISRGSRRKLFSASGQGAKKAKPLDLELVCQGHDTDSHGRCRETVVAGLDAGQDDDQLAPETIERRYTLRSTWSRPARWRRSPAARFSPPSFFQFACTGGVFHGAGIEEQQ